jgi:hypothetical protein
MGEIIFAVLMVGCLLVPSLIFKQWWLFSVFLIFGICFGLVEWFAVMKTGKSISQQFWIFSQEHKWKAIIILGNMLIAWVSLLAHLGYKMFKKKEE